MDYHKLKNILLSLILMVSLLYPLIATSLTHSDVNEEVQPIEIIKPATVKIIYERDRQPVDFKTPTDKAFIKSEVYKVFGDKGKIAFAILMAESSGNYKVTGYNKDKRKTHDRGLFQINSYWHSEVSDSCAYSIKCNIKEAYRISSHGTNWNQWYTWRDKKHLRFM